LADGKDIGMPTATVTVQCLLKQFQQQQYLHSTLYPVIERNARVRARVHDDGNTGPLWFRQQSEQHLDRGD
jgi:hypothetical protein